MYKNDDCLSYFWRYFPLLSLTVIMHWFLIHSETLLSIFMILGINV